MEKPLGRARRDWYNLANSIRSPFIRCTTTSFAFTKPFVLPRRWLRGDNEALGIDGYGEIVGEFIGRRKISHDQGDKTACEIAANKYNRTLGERTL